MGGSGLGGSGFEGSCFKGYTSGAFSTTAAFFPLDVDLYLLFVDSALDACFYIAGAGLDLIESLLLDLLIVLGGGCSSCCFFFCAVGAGDCFCWLLRERPVAGDFG